MLDHHLQRSIVYKLALSEGLRFSELKPDGIENKLFDYHLKKVISAGIAEKNTEGIYQLTPAGRRLGVRVLDTSQVLVDKADSVLFLAIKKDNAWLLYQRRAHPLRGQAGFMHAVPVANEPVAQTAKRECKDKTGLTCDFRPLGGGYFRVYRDGSLESFTHFTLLVADTISGELNPQDELADYFWKEEPDFSGPEMLPNMKLLTECCLDGKPFFIEETFEL
jgi:ADP-ribose pyrophosphatase YjhB (NUDIX family)